MSGRVVFVGAGPGAADLITLRGARWLACADVVLCDALTDPALREFAPAAQWIDVGKRGFSADATAQARIDALLVQMAQRHAVVVRLKGGDPSIFGRLEEELVALGRAGIECEVVPGVTAALAAAAQTQRPLTRRGHGRSVSLSSAMTHQGELRAGRHADTEVFYMAGRQLGKLARALRVSGWPGDAPVSVVSRTGWSDRLASDHVLTELAAAAVLHAGRPTVVTIGAGAAPVGSATCATQASVRSGRGVGSLPVPTGTGVATP
ncbi:MAG: uroporphyrinogen-III C-methyltransferase [Pseudomonadota bacterium]|nr:uroporphyrinogen-III C-methyltransferase [Pseudomonadota bacterium]